MSSPEPEDVGADISGLGLSSVLASVGIDPSFLDRAGVVGSSSVANQLQEDDAEEKYMDDVSEVSLPSEGEEVKKARAAEQASEARFRRQAEKMMADAERKKKSLKKEEGAEQRVKRVWPDFEKGKRLKMTEVFYDTPMMRKVWAEEVSRNKRRKLDVQTYAVKVAPNTATPPQAVFLSNQLEPLTPSSRGKPLYTTPLGALFDPARTRQAKSIRRQKMTKPPRGLTLGPELPDEGRASPDYGNPLELADWEDGIIMCSLNNPEIAKLSDPLAPRNDILESGDWLKEVIWDARRVSPDLVEDDQEGAIESAPIAKSVQTGLLPTSKLDPFNLSNDHLYEHHREARFRIRQTFGSIEVFHSQPAKTLQMPFYKTTLTKTEARAWRRPALQFPAGVTLTFSKLKSNPSAAVSTKKKAMMADPAERFKTTRDLTVSEKGPFVLLEFSEEYPPIMSGYGMGTTIVNYYRKQDDKDDTVPKLDFGQPSILNVGDAEPFLLGYVDQGKVTQVIHNNLIRAPIFRHQAEPTDFLVVRHTVNGHTTYHLRQIANLYTVGQTVPNESEVPGPHARKNTNTAKLRLMIVAWLLIQKAKQKRIKMSKLLKYFPDQTELQMRQRLKIKGNEFLEYARQAGPNQGFWTLNPNYDFPKSRKEVLELLTPEAAMLYEAMQVGARHLHDAGYSKTAEGNADEEFGEDQAGLDIEQQLAVWSTTLNYKRAEAQKAWLVVHGDGDPTGRGEGFSFLKTNMKGYFLRRGETEQGRRLEMEQKAGGNPVKISNAEQQRIYEEEKRRVWDLQAKALANPNPPELLPEDEIQPVTATPAGLGPRFVRSDSRRALSRGGSMAAPWTESPRDGSPGGWSQDGESTFTGNNASVGKVLRITRIIKGKKQVEIVRDSAVIASYQRRLEERKLEMYAKNPELLKPTGDKEEDEYRRIA
ncbi:hypothetical protein BCR39DRAFT_554452 [Naematelia encephala]|uniref:Transcription initiation factor TFIID subunit 1 histone acetyltransferase domain-containing protein n=1 Tax=Naematelia encephala TaxID=71784 RepID=A0A1Y2AEG1_9TREE|nr:hypothetical protein BCR39DRAFT_554452 [Naematelia encephala]